MAKQTVGSLRAELTLDGKQYRLALSKAEKQTRSFGASASKGFSMAIRGAGIIGAAGVAGIAAFAAVIDKAADRIDRLAKTSSRLGIATEQLAGLQLAGEQTGVKIDTMNMALQRMTRRVAEAAMGTGEAKAAIAELGLNAQQLASLSPDQQFRRLADAMNGVSNQGDRVRLAMKLFDSEGVALVNTLKMGSRGLDDFASKAKDMGLAISAVDAERIEAANDAVNMLKRSFDGAANELAVTLAPVIEAAAGTALELLESFEASEDQITALGNTAQFVFGTMLDGMQMILISVHGMEVSISSAIGAWALLQDKLGMEIEDPMGVLKQLAKGEAAQKRVEQLRREWASETLAHHLSTIRTEQEARRAAAADDTAATAKAGASALKISADRIRAIRAEHQAGMEAAAARAAARQAEAQAEVARISSLEMQFETESDRIERQRAEKEKAAWDLVWAGKRSADWAAEQEIALELWKQEQIKALQGGDKLEMERQQVQQRLQMLQMAGMTELEQHKAQHQMEMEQLRVQYAGKAALEEEYLALRNAKIQEYNAQRAQIEAMSAKHREQSFYGDASNILSGFNALGNALLKDTKAFNIGMAIANTALGVTKALSLGNWPLAFATAASGVAQVAAITKAGKGKGSVAGVTGGSAAGGGAGGAPQAAAPQIENQSLTIEVRRSAGGVSREEAAELYEALTDVAKDRNDNTLVRMS